MYYDLLEYMKKMENLDINLLFDRTFFTEEVYCRLGKKDYSFTEEYEKLVSMLNDYDFDIYYITLYLEDTSLFAQRLNRGEKAVYDHDNYGYEIDANLTDCCPHCGARMDGE